MLDAEHEPVRRERVRLAIALDSAWAICCSCFRASPAAICEELKSSSVGTSEVCAEAEVVWAGARTVEVEEVFCARAGERTDDRPRSNHAHLLRTAILGKLKRVLMARQRGKKSE
jgi:hypothetical protein